MPTHDPGNPLITVVIPAFNAEKYLRDTIESALAQTIPDIEIIVVDDGSTDTTREIAMDCARRDARVRVLVNERSCWASGARNRAIQAARSRYIALLDSDDLWLPDFLATQMAAFAEFPDAMVVTGNVRSFGGAHDARLYRPLDSERRRLSLLEMIEREDSVCIMSVFRREVFDTIGGFDLTLFHNEDYDFWLRAAAAGCVFVQTVAPVGLYRRRPDSKSADELETLTGIRLVLEKARAYCANRPAELAAVNRQIVRFEREALAVRAKQALRRREFPTAAELYGALHQREPGTTRAVLATASRYLPRAVFWIDRVRSAWRKSRVKRPMAPVALVLIAFATLAIVPRTVTVHAGEDLQHALNLANPGDTILLEPAATFVGNFVLPAKSGSDVRPIVLRTAGADIPETERISPETARQLAKLQSPNASPALRTEPRAHHWRIELLEIRSGPDGGDEIVSLGDGSSAQRTIGDVPSDLIFDRVYIHGDPSAAQRRGIGLQAARVTISNSYISEIKGVGYDTQAICGWNGPGDYVIENNYLEAAGENVMFGGADPWIPNLTPTNIVIRGNTVSKPLRWHDGGSRWQIKNLFELKNARRVTVDGNIFENNWQAAQPGFAILFTVRNDEGRCSWCQVDQVTFTNNIVRHVAAGISILGSDDIHPSRQTQGIVIRNNLIHDIDPKTWGGSGYAFLIVAAPRDITVDHNTILQENASGIIQVEGPPILGFSFTNNVALQGAYGIIGTDHAPGNDSIAAFFPGSRFAGNVIAGAQGSYPAGNRYPSVSDFRQQFVSYTGGDYQLVSGSAWRGAATDGSDIGVRFTTLVRDASDNRTPRRASGN